MFKGELLALPRLDEGDGGWDEDALKRVDVSANAVIERQPGISVIVSNQWDYSWVVPQIENLPSLKKRIQDKSLIVVSTQDFGYYSEWRHLRNHKELVFPLIMKAFIRQNIKFDVVYSYGDEPADMKAAMGVVENDKLASSWIGVKFNYFGKHGDFVWDAYDSLALVADLKNRSTTKKKKAWLALKKKLLDRFLTQQESLIRIGGPPRSHLIFTGPICQVDQPIRFLHAEAVRKEHMDIQTGWSH